MPHHLYATRRGGGRSRKVPTAKFADPPGRLRLLSGLEGDFLVQFPGVWGPGNLGPSPQPPPQNLPQTPIPLQPARLKSLPGLSGAPWAIRTRRKVIREAVQGPPGTILGPKIDRTRRKVLGEALQGPSGTILGPKIDSLTLLTTFYRPYISDFGYNLSKLLLSKRVGAPGRSPKELSLPPV